MPRTRAWMEMQMTIQKWKSETCHQPFISSVSTSEMPSRCNIVLIHSVPWSKMTFSYCSESEEEQYTDDEDTSWKVRKAAARLLTFLIRSYPSLLPDIYKQASKTLISRFKEREENVKLEVLSTFAELIVQVNLLHPSSPFFIVTWDGQVRLGRSKISWPGCMLAHTNCTACLELLTLWGHRELEAPFYVFVLKPSQKITVSQPCFTEIMTHKFRVINLFGLTTFTEMKPEVARDKKKIISAGSFNTEPSSRERESDSFHSKWLSQSH